MKEEPVLFDFPGTLRRSWERVGPGGMTAAAFQGKRALFFLDDAGRIFRADVAKGSLRSPRRVGTAPVSCDSLRVAVADSMIYILVPSDRPRLCQLLAAPHGEQFVSLRWHMLPLPKGVGSPRQFWVEQGRLLIVGLRGERPVMCAARIEKGRRTLKWDFLFRFPPGACPEAVTGSSRSFLIASRSPQAGVVDLSKVSPQRPRALSPIARIADIKGEVSLTLDSGRLILLDGGDFPGRARIHLASLDERGVLRPWVSQAAGYGGILRSMCGMVVGDTLLVVGRSDSVQARHAPISSYTTSLPRWPA